MDMSKKQQVTLLRQAFDRLPEMRSGFRSMKDALLDILTADEKHHRQGRGRAGISINDAAKLFAVRWIAEYMKHPHRRPALKDYMVMRPGVFLAASLVENFEQEIRVAWMGIDIDALLALDYAKLMEA